jgi:hypothetical protein
LNKSASSHCQPSRLGTTPTALRLHQEFAASEVGLNDQFALQKPWIAQVAFGSKADIGLALVDVRFTPKSGHQLSAL